MRWIVVLAALLAAAPASGQSDQDRKDCEWSRADIAISACTRLLESGKLEPTARVAALKKRAFRYSESEDWRRALRDYDELVSLDARNPDSFYFRGAVYLQLRQYGRAIEDLSKAIALKPDFGLAFVLRGQAESARGQHQRAIADFGEALQHALGMNEIFCWRGKAHEALGNRDAAIRDFKGGLDRDAIGDRECRDGLKRLGASP
jgi:tetratricopeptide (TPR) repeat protein